MIGGRAHRRRIGAVAGAALALLAGSTSAAKPLEHVPVYRYYALVRTDTKPHAIRGTFYFKMEHKEAFAAEWVMETRHGRQYFFDRGYVTYGLPGATVEGRSTPDCATIGAACTALPDEQWLPVRVGFPVWLDFFLVTRDAVASVDLSESPDKHWRLVQLTGDPRVTGKLHILDPSDGDVTSVAAFGYAAQQIRDIGFGGGRYGSIALARAPSAPWTLVVPVTSGSAQLDGGQRYYMEQRRIEGRVADVVGWHPGPTTWRLHGDLTTVGWGGGVVLVVYDLPEPKSLRAFLRKH